MNPDNVDVPEFHGPYLSPGMQYTDIDADKWYILKSHEKVVSEGPIVYYYVKVIGKDDDEVKYKAYYSRSEGDDEWEPIQLDTDIEDWPIDAIEKAKIDEEQLTGSGNGNKFYMQYHFYELPPNSQGGGRGRRRSKKRTIRRRKSRKMRKTRYSAKRR